MDVLRALGAEILKMFAADLWLSLTALGAVGACGLSLQAGVLPAVDLPFWLAGGIVAALAVGVVRGARS